MISRSFTHLLRKLSYSGWTGAMVTFLGIDGYERYTKIARLLSRAGCNTILDVGSAGISPLRYMGYQCLSCDIKATSKTGLDIVASITHLPFRSKIFDCVTAVDVLEHVQSDKREQAIFEMKRCGSKVMVHTPLYDGKVFMGEVGDLELYQFNKRGCSRIDGNVLEHIINREPSPSELQKHGFKIVEPDWNLKTWLIFMKLQSLRGLFPGVLGYLFSGLISLILIPLYLVILRNINNPPYWGGYLTFG
jgi:hypothetical protein